MTRPLDAFELWMVERSLEYVKTEGLQVVVARLKVNGYLRVARKVEQEWTLKKSLQTTSGQSTVTQP